MSTRPPSFPASSRAAWLLALAVFALCATLAIGVSAQLRQFELGEIERTRTQSVNSLIKALEARFMRYGDFLRTAAALFQSSPALSHRQWGTFVAATWELEGEANSRNAGIAYLPRVEAHERAAWEFRTSAELGIPIAIWPQDGDGPHFPVAYMSPDTLGNRQIVGRDTYADPTRRAAIDAAIADGKPRLSGPLALFNEGEGQQGALLVHAVYRAPVPPSASARQATALGVVAIGLRYADWIQPLLRDNDFILGLSLYDEGSAHAPADSLPVLRTAQFGQLPPRTATAVQQRHLELGGRRLRLHFSLPEPPASAHFGSQATLLAGTLAGGLLALLVHHLVDQRSRARALAERMTADLRDSERRFALAIEASSEGIWEWRPGQPVFLTPRCQRLLQPLPPGPHGWRRLLHRVARPERRHVLGALRAHLLERKALDLALSLNGNETTVRFVRLRACAEWDADGRALRVAGSLTDITPLRQREIELERTRNFLYRLIEIMPNAVVVKNGRGQYVLINRAGCELFGRDASDILGKRAIDLLPPEQARRNDEDDIKVIRFGMRIEREDLWPYRDGRIGRVIIRKARIDDAEGQHAVIVTLIDITPLRTAEAELRRHRDALSQAVEEQTRDLVRARDTAEAANAAKSLFLANMSHELRTPLHAVLSYARLGEERIDRTPAERLHEYFTRIRSSAERLLQLLNNLLDLSKMEAGRMHLDLRPIALAPLVSEALHEFEALLVARRLHARFDVPPDLPNARADAYRFGQVVRNLLSNAVRYCPADGALQLSLGCVAHPEEPHVQMVCLSVSDTGPGIPEGELDSIFDKFVQSSKTRSNAGGTGLGLAICKEIVEAHGGHIRALNRPPPEQGARLEVYWPRAT